MSFLQLVPFIQVQLGDIVFDDFEIPEKIPFGGAQRVVNHKLVGGLRIIDALGPDDIDIGWTGRFRGDLAKVRAQYLDGLRRAGLAVTLSWDDFTYQVVVVSFEADYERAYEIPYKISCLVVSDNRNPIGQQVQPNIDQVVNGDLANAVANLGDFDFSQVNLAPNLTAVSGGLTGVQSSVSAAGILEGNLAGLRSVNTALGGAQTVTTTALAAAYADIAAIGSYGGAIVPSPGVLAPSALINAASCVTNGAALQWIAFYLGRMGLNVTAAISGAL